MLNHPDFGKLLLRLTLGTLILLHGLHKLLHGVGGVKALLMMHNLPDWLAYGVYVGEVVAPLMLIVGYYSRAAAAIIAGNMLVAVVLAHMAELTRLTAQGGWALELQGMFLFSALALMLLGPGKYVLKN